MRRGSTRKMNHPSPQVELTFGLRTARLVRRALALSALSKYGEEKTQLARVVRELDEKIQKADIRWVNVEVIECRPTEVASSSSSPDDSNGNGSRLVSDE